MLAPREPYVYQLYLAFSKQYILKSLFILVQYWWRMLCSYMFGRITGSSLYLSLTFRLMDVEAKAAGLVYWNKFRITLFRYWQYNHLLVV